MRKIASKFIIGIIAVLLVSTLTSALLIHKFVEKYYLHQKKDNVVQIGNRLLEELEQGTPLDDAIKELEDTNKVLIVYTDNSRSHNDIINDQLRKAFLAKGIGFQRFWLWENDYQDILAGRQKIRLYHQKKLNYSLLAEYITYDSMLISVVMIVPNIADAFKIMSTLAVAINAGTLFLSIMVIIFLINKITSPLQEFQRFAYHMGHNNFMPLHIQTNDELKQVADNLNEMGSAVVSYQASLYNQTKEMEQLLDNAAHELKTPVSLIKLYAGGIQDGLDDGTFLNTIIQQNSQMEHMINRLLHLTRIDKENALTVKYHLSLSLEKLLDEYTILAEERNLEFERRIAKDIVIETNQEWITSLLTNLISNAIKYSSGKQITVSLHEEPENRIITISNKTSNTTLDLNKIWIPYYVGETSRNKHLSGTGLGLPLVKKLADRLHYTISCELQTSIITFKLQIPCAEKSVHKTPVKKE